MSSTDFAGYMEAAEKFQQHFVVPMVTAVETKLTTMLQPVIDANQSLAKRVKDHDDAIAALQGSQKKALAGWGVFSAGLAAGLAYAWTWIKSHIHVG